MRLITLLALVLTSSLVHAGGSIELTYDQSEDYADLEFRGRNDEEALAYFDEVMQPYLASLGDLLTQGQLLQITLHDIDMAGEILPTRGTSLERDVRIIRQPFHPKFDLSYCLLDAAGQELASGREKIRDLDFDSAAGRRQSVAPLEYEKHLLRRFIVKLTG